VWLSRKSSEADAELVITTTINQESPVSQGMRPILVLDVWEHSYYLKHQFRLHVYVADWWKVVDWNGVQALDNWWSHGDAHTKDEL
jgi:Fe-Mn family superoxide dismutase